MSVSILSLRSLALAFLCLPLSTIQAEMGKGTVEDPITREYARGVYKDWQEGAVLDSETGNYIVTYKAWNGHFESIILEPATKIDPTLKSKFKRIENSNAVRYEYKLRNGPKAKQNIEMFLTHVSNINPGGPVAPPDWDGRAFPTLTDSNLRLSWTHEGVGPSGGLAPGKSAGGFWIESNDLPGIVIMEIKGNARHTTWLGHQPSIETPVGKQVLELEAKNFVPRFVAVPKIVVPTPFDAAIVLTGIQKHIKDDLIGMKLIDPVLASQLDRSLQAAIDAAKINNTAAVRSNLKEARKLFKKEHEDVDSEDDQGFDKDDATETKKSALIDRLAARVLDFDLKYVEKRLKVE